MQTKQSTRYLRYEFSTEELEEMANTVYDNIASVHDLKAKQKASNKKFGEQIKALEETNVHTGHLIQEGFEGRSIAVEITYNKPKDGFKTIVRMDDHTAWEEEMLPDEYNLENLPLPGSMGNDEEE